MAGMEVLSGANTNTHCTATKYLQGLNLHKMTYTIRRHIRAFTNIHLKSPFHYLAAWRGMHRHSQILVRSLLYARVLFDSI